MNITKRQLRRIIHEERARLKETPKRSRLRKLIREEADTAGGAPNVGDIARKVSSLGPEGALQWIGDLIASLDVAAGGPAPPPPVEEPLPEDM